MGIGDKKKALMEADKGAPGGVAALDASGAVSASAFSAVNATGGRRGSHYLDATGNIVLDTADGSGNYAQMVVSAEGAGEPSITLQQRKDGTTVTRAVYHTGNKPTAADCGAVPVTGGTMSGNLIVSRAEAARLDAVNTAAGRTARVQAGIGGYAEIGNVGSDGYVTLVLDKETNDIDDMVAINRKAGGTSTKYKLFGEHNLTALRDALKAIWED